MVLKSCRCCCATMRLEKAAKIIGVIFTILGAIAVVYTAVNLYQLDAGHDQLVAELTKLFPHRDTEAMFQHSRTLLVVRLCAAISLTLFSAILVAGVRRESQRLVLTFVIFYALYLAVYTIATFYAFYDPSVFIDEMVISKLRKDNVDLAKVIIYVSLTVSLAIYAFFYYLAVVVFSYYKELSRSAPTKEHRQLF